VDLSRHESKSVRHFLSQPMDLVVTVCDSARDVCPVFPKAKQVIHDAIPDPISAAGLREDVALARFREARDLIRERIVRHVREALAIP
jgi:arsenate reductase